MANQRPLAAQQTGRGAGPGGSGWRYLSFALKPQRKRVPLSHALITAPPYQRMW